MEKWSTKDKTLEKWGNQLNLDLCRDLKKKKHSLQTSQTYPAGGRGRRINVPCSLLKYPVMKETDILEIASLHLIQKQLKIPEYDDMKMLRELFVEPQAPELFYGTSHHVHRIPDHILAQKENSVLECSLPEEKLFILGEQYSYIDFLKTLDEKDCFVIIEHVPLDAVKNIEALITSFGEIVLFRDSLSRNNTEKIVLVKMASTSECNWVVSCLDGHAWGEKELSATKVDDIFNSQVSKTRSASKIEDCIEVKGKEKGQFEDSESLINMLLDTPVSKELSNVCDKNDGTLSCDNEPGISVPQYLDLPSTCSLSNESILIFNAEHNYIEFLQTLDEKECFSVIEHIPLDAEESLENLISTFGEITLFHVDMSRNGNEKIGLVKMATSSHCDSIISCLNNCAWGKNILTIRKLEDIISLL